MSHPVRIRTSTGWQDLATVGPQGPPGAGAPDATTIAKGSIQLAGDLTGTAALPRIAAGVVTDGSKLYVQSRGLNLITNGSGLLGTNENFSAFTFDPVETHGGGGSFRINITADGRFSDEAMALDTSQTWVLTGWGKSGDANGANYNAANTQYLGIASYDIDGSLITAPYAGRHPGSVNTTLAVALNPGNTTMTLTSATGWGDTGSAYSRTFSWWPYVNSKGYSYPAYGYTRNFSAIDAWAPGGVSGNVITLRAPWAGPALPAGTPVRRILDGGTYKYIAAANAAVPNVWTRYRGYLSGVDTLGDNISSQFFAGTAFVRLVFLVNLHGPADNIVRWSDLSFESQFDTRFGDFAITGGGLTATGDLWTAANVYANTGFVQAGNGGNAAYFGGVLLLGANNLGDGAGNWGDTNLFRLGASMLKTDASFVAGGSLFVGNNGAGGTIFLGSAADTSLYRSATSKLKTDGDLEVAGVLTTPKLTGLGAPSAGADAANKTYVDTRTKTFRTSHTWAVAGAITAGMNIPGIFLPEAGSQATTIVGFRAVTLTGTSATVQLTRNGASLGSATAVTTTAATTALSQAVTADDLIRPTITAISGAPADLTYSLLLEHVV